MPAYVSFMALLERDHHLEALDAWLREAASGQGRLVLVAGEAGIGKSALVQRFAADVANQGRARILHGACDPLSTPRPLAPLQDVAYQTGGRSIVCHATRTRGSRPGRWADESRDRRPP